MAYSTYSRCAAAGRTDRPVTRGAISALEIYYACCDLQPQIYNLQPSRNSLCRLGERIGALPLAGTTTGHDGGEFGDVDPHVVLVRTGYPRACRKEALRPEAAVPQEVHVVRRPAGPVDLEDEAAARRAIQIVRPLEAHALYAHDHLRAARDGHLVLRAHTLKVDCAHGQRKARAHATQPLAHQWIGVSVFGPYHFLTLSHLC